METVLDSVIDALSAIVVALIGVGLFRTSRRIKRVQHHVENDHDLNLRDDLDRKFVGLANLVGAAQRDITWIIRRQVDLDTRVDDIEDTLGGTRKEQRHAEEPSPYSPGALPLRNRSRGRSSDSGRREP